jgi:hypothetical protein
MTLKRRFGVSAAAKLYFPEAKTSVEVVGGYRRFFMR